MMNKSETASTKQRKQATRGEKQILDENQSTVNYYFKVLVISNGVYLTLRYLFFWESFVAKFIVLYALTALVASIAYYFISYMGRPMRDESGAVIGAGSDLNMQGVISNSLFKAFILENNLNQAFLFKVTYRSMPKTLFSFHA